MKLVMNEEETRRLYEGYPVINPKKFRRRYNPGIIRNTFFRPYGETRMSLLEKEIHQNAVVLDLGAGTGIYSLCLKEKRPDLKIINLDLSSAFLQKNPAKYKIQANAKKLPFKDCSFDYAFCVEVLHHINNIEEGIKEVKRVVRKGFIISEINLFNPLCFLWCLFCREERGAVLKNHQIKIKKVLKQYFKIRNVRYYEFFPYYQPFMNKFALKVFRALECLSTTWPFKFLSAYQWIYCEKD